MESNPYNAGNAQWKMLATIVEQLLRRGQLKVTTQLRKVVTTPDDIDWARVYTPHEQCGYVLGRVAGSAELLDYVPAVARRPSAVPRAAAQRAAEPSVPRWLLGYANVVFRDYVHAWGLLAESAAAHDAVRKALREEEYLPSPLLGAFVIISNMAPGSAAVAGQDLGFIYESLLTQGDNHLFIYRDPGEPAEVFLGDDPDWSRPLCRSSAGRRHPVLAAAGAGWHLRRAHRSWGARTQLHPWPGRDA